MYEAGMTAQGCWDELDSYQQESIERLANLIIKECDKLNKKQSYELLGVIIDTEEGDGFDEVCLNTVKRIKEYLSANTFEKHFEIEEMQLIAGADKMSGDGGYQIGTKEGYDAFEEKRNAN
jgi:hypothetical protein